MWVNQIIYAIEIGVTLIFPLDFRDLMRDNCSQYRLEYICLPLQIECNDVCLSMSTTQSTAISNECF